MFVLLTIYIVYQGFQGSKMHDKNPGISKLNTKKIQE